MTREAIIFYILCLLWALYSTVLLLHANMLRKKAELRCKAWRDKAIELDKRKADEV